MLDGTLEFFRLDARRRERADPDPVSGRHERRGLGREPFDWSAEGGENENPAHASPMGGQPSRRNSTIDSPSSHPDTPAPPDRQLASGSNGLACVPKLASLLLFDGQLPPARLRT